MIVACPTAEAVSEIERKLHDRIGSRRYQLWFKNATRLAVDGQQLRVQVPNNYIKGWIENHFSKELRSIAEETLHQEISLSFEIDPELLKKPSSNSQAAGSSVESADESGQRETTAFRLRRKLRNNLDTFIVGEGNELAYNMIQTVADKVISPFNPLYIHGSCGLGKTHLLQGLCNALSERHPEVGWQYVSGEEFTNQFIVAVRTGALDAFRQQYRNVDVLVIDDVHFLANKRATQEEFLHTFNAINAAGKQVVMASDSHPKSINLLPKPLVDRFLSGMVVQISPPDELTRIKIVQARASQLGHHLPEGVAQLIAHRIRGNIRELEGSILKLIAYSSLCNKPISLAIANQVIKEYGNHVEPEDLQIRTIEQKVAEYFNVTVGDLQSTKRTKTIALARATAMYLARKNTPMSFPEIGKTMGDKNHSTVLLACKRIETMIQKNEAACWSQDQITVNRPIADVISDLEAQLKNTRE
jgi:chromosomal replication initiator protein